MRLHLGVIEMPYAAAETAAQRRARIKRGEKKPAGTVTTGDVATILEEHYGVMGHFFDAHKEDVVEALTEGVRGAIESIVAGAPPTLDPFGDATQKIQTSFHDFITRHEVERLGVEGVPTAAALAGKSSRFKKRRGPPRPSFVDTGLYLNSFRAWVDR